MSAESARYVQAETASLVHSNRYRLTLRIQDAYGNSTKTFSLSVGIIDALQIFLEEEKQRVLALGKVA